MKLSEKLAIKTGHRVSIVDVCDPVFNIESIGVIVTDKNFNDVLHKSFTTMEEVETFIHDYKGE